MKIRIKTLDRGDIEFEIDADASLLELRNVIESHTTVPITRQRLIFRGHPLLNNERKLAEYGITDGMTLHMVEKPFNVNPTSGTVDGQHEGEGLGNADQTHRGEERARVNVINGEITISREQIFQDIDTTLGLVRRALENTLSNLTESTSSEIELQEDAPNHGDLSVQVRIRGNALHHADSGARERLLRITDTLNRSESVMQILNDVLVPYLNDWIDEPREFISSDSTLSVIDECLLRLEEVMTAPRSVDDDKERTTEAMETDESSGPPSQPEQVQPTTTNSAGDANSPSSTSDASASSSTTATNPPNIIEHSTGSDYMAVLQRLTQLQFVLNEHMIRYKNLIGTSVAPTTGNVFLRHLLVVYQEQIQRLLHRFAHIYHSISDISVDFGSEHLPSSSNLRPLETSYGHNGGTEVVLSIIFVSPQGGGNASNAGTQSTTSRHEVINVTRSPNEPAQSAHSMLHAVTSHLRNTVSQSNRDTQQTQPTNTTVENNAPSGQAPVISYASTMVPPPQQRSSQMPRFIRATNFSPASRPPGSYTMSGGARPPMPPPRAMFHVAGAGAPPGAPVMIRPGGAPIRLPHFVSTNVMPFPIQGAARFHFTPSAAPLQHPFPPPPPSQQQNTTQSRANQPSSGNATQDSSTTNVAAHPDFQQIFRTILGDPNIFQNMTTSSSSAPPPPQQQPQQQSANSNTTTTSNNASLPSETQTQLSGGENAPMTNLTRGGSAPTIATTTTQHQNPASAPGNTTTTHQHHHWITPPPLLQAFRAPFGPGIMGQVIVRTNGPAANVEATRRAVDAAMQAAASTVAASQGATGVHINGVGVVEGNISTGAAGMPLLNTSTSGSVPHNLHFLSSSNSTNPSANQQRSVPTAGGQHSGGGGTSVMGGRESISWIRRAYANRETQPESQSQPATTPSDTTQQHPPSPHHHHHHPQNDDPHNLLGGMFIGPSFPHHSPIYTTDPFLPCQSRFGNPRYTVRNSSDYEATIVSVREAALRYQNNLSEGTPERERANAITARWNVIRGGDETSDDHIMMNQRGEAVFDRAEHFSSVIEVMMRRAVANMADTDPDVARQLHATSGEFDNFNYSITPIVNPAMRAIGLPMPLLGSIELESLSADIEIASADEMDAQQQGGNTAMNVIENLTAQNAAARVESLIANATQNATQQSQNRDSSETSANRTDTAQGGESDGDILEMIRALSNGIQSGRSMTLSQMMRETGQPVTRFESGFINLVMILAYEVIQFSELLDLFSSDFSTIYNNRQQIRRYIIENVFNDNSRPSQEDVESAAERVTLSESSLDCFLAYDDVHRYTEVDGVGRVDLVATVLRVERYSIIRFLNAFLTRDEGNIDARQYSQHVVDIFTDYVRRIVVIANLSMTSGPFDYETLLLRYTDQSVGRNDRQLIQWLSQISIARIREFLARGDPFGVENMLDDFVLAPNAEQDAAVSIADKAATAAEGSGVHESEHGNEVVSKQNCTSSSEKTDADVPKSATAAQQSTNEVTIPKTDVSGGDNKKVSEPENEQNEDSNWKAVLPQDWLPVIETDRRRLTSMTRQPCLSDAYLCSSSISQKKAKMMNRIESGEDFMHHAVSEAFNGALKQTRQEQKASTAASNLPAEFSRAAQNEFDEAVLERVHNDPDYEPHKFVQLKKFCSNKRNGDDPSSKS